MKLFLQRFEARFAVLALAALLIAQAGAMAHAYSHDASFNAAKHGSAADSHDPCKDCLAYAPLLAGAGALGTLPSIEPPGRGEVTRTFADSLVDLSLTLAFRSRAPPAIR